MPATNTALSQRGDYEPSGFTKFLWWLSTAEKELLADAVVDRNRYRIIGMTVLATWAFATLAWTYFFITIVSNLFIAVSLGFFMGFIILTIDRALIKGITKFNRNKFAPLLLRGLLAFTIGTFMAQPAVLYMFDKEIRLQTSLDNEKKKQLKKSEITAFYKDRKSELAKEKDVLQKQLDAKYNDVNVARENYLAESDGSGGTGKVGIAAIALAKKNEYEKLDAEYKQLLQTVQPQLKNTDDQLTGINDSIKKQEQEFTTYFNDGFLTRIEALNNLIKGNPALQFRYYLIVVILLLIELMPVISKTLLPSGTYDEKVLLREEMEREMSASNIKKEKELKELYNSLAKETDEDIIRTFFSMTEADRKEKIREFARKWREENHQTFDGVWEKMKREVLTKQEN